MSFSVYPPQPTQWLKFSVSHTQFQTAGTTNNITLFSLPAKTLILKTVIKQSASFTGGAISAYTLSVGITGTLAKYLAAFDVFQAPGATVFAASSTSIAQTLENFEASTAIKIAATSTMANLNASTAGAADIYVLTSLLP